MYEGEFKSYISPSDFTVLLVDDQADVLSTHEVLLKRNGYKTYTALGGEEAVEAVRTLDIDILVVDYYMQPMNGEMVIEKIREFNSEIVIILQTGYAEQKPAKEMFRKLDIQGYYDKNGDSENLLISVMMAARMCEQIKETKKMVSDINQAHETLKAMKEDQARMIEQVRLAGLGQKVGSMFHDMVNPLVGIEYGTSFIQASTAEILNQHKNGAIDVEKNIDTLNKMLEKCDAINKRIAHIKEMKNVVVAQSRQEKMNIPLSFTIERFLEKINFFAVDDLRRYSCELTIDNQTSPETKLYGKEVSLLQVIDNLILNSAQAYGKGGEIRLKVTEDRYEVTFSVSDTAGGIPKEIQGKLLNEMVTTKGNEGSGIGIRSSYLVIKDYFKGKMRFESDGQTGTTFYVKIPK